MKLYFVNDHPQQNGDHEVHEKGCYWLTLANHTTPLGMHASCQTAVAAAKKIHKKANGCKTCSYECHTS